MSEGKDYIGVSTAIFLFNVEGQILLLKRSTGARDEHGRWDLVGGKLDFGSRLVDNVIKEMNEEVGLEASDVELLSLPTCREVFRSDQKGLPSHWVCHDYVGIVHDKNKPYRKEPDKFDDMAWFSLDALPSPLHSQLSEEVIGSAYDQLLQAKVGLSL